MNHHPHRGTTALVPAFPSYDDLKYLRGERVNYANPQHPEHHGGYTVFEVHQYPETTRREAQIWLSLDPIEDGAISIFTRSTSVRKG